MLHALAQLGHRAAAFFFAHVVQAFDGLFQRRRHMLVSSSSPASSDLAAFRAPGSFSTAFRSGSALTPNSSAACAKGAQVSADQFAIDRERRSAGALQAERDFDMSTMQALLEHPAHLHLDGIEFVGHPQVQVEEAMVHRLQAQRDA